MVAVCGWTLRHGHSWLTVQLDISTNRRPSGRSLLRRTMVLFAVLNTLARVYDEQHFAKPIPVGQLFTGSCTCFD